MQTFFGFEDLVYSFHRCMNGSAERIISKRKNCSLLLCLQFIFPEGFSVLNFLLRMRILTAGGGPGTALPDQTVFRIFRFHFFTNIFAPGYNRILFGIC